MLNTENIAEHVLDFNLEGDHIFSSEGKIPELEDFDCVDFEEPAGPKPEPEPEPELIDTAEAERMLMALLGHTKVIACAYGETNRYTPARQGEKYDWAAVPETVDWGKVRSDLQYASTKNLGFISCPGGTRVKDRQGKPAEIFECSLLVYEIDGLPKEEQWGLWEKAGIGEPTLVMDTGNNSLHVWLRLAEPVTPEQGRIARKRLSLAMEAKLPEGVKTDWAMHSTHQPARLAGGIHPKTGNRSTIVLETGKVFNLDELMAKCPELPIEQKSTSTTGTIWRADPYDAPTDYSFSWDATAHHLQGVTVPLSVALGAETLNDIENGVEAGQGRRAGRAWSIGCSLQCAEAQLTELGVPFSESAQELFEQFVSNSGVVDDYCNGSVDAAFDSYWEQGDIGEGDLSRWALTRKLDEIEINCLIANPKPGGFLWRGKQATAKAWQVITRRRQAERQARLLQAADIRHKARPAKDLDKRMDVLDRYIRALVANVPNSRRRMAKLREAHKALNLGTAISNRELAPLVLEKQDEKGGNTYKTLTAAERAAMEKPKVEWLIPNVMPKNDLTIIGGRPKVGKSRAGLWLAKVLLQRDDFLGFGRPTEDHTVILVTDDQGDGDTADMLTGLGVYDHPRLLWSRRFRVTPKQLDALLADIKANPGAVVIIDSLRSISRSSGLSENDPEMGVLLYDLKQAVLDAGGSLALVHHASKSNDHVGQEALSGHNSIPSAANTIVTMHYLPGKGNNTLQKNIPERRLVREARSGPGFDLVVTMRGDGTFGKVDDYDAFQQEQLEAEQGTKGTHQLRKATLDQQKVLVALLDDFRADGNGLSVLQMMINSEIAPKTTKAKRDLGKDGESKYNSLNRAMRRFIGLGLVEEAQDHGSWTGQGTLYRLTETGREVVAAELG